MDADQKFWLSFVIVVALVIASITVCTSVHYTLVARSAFVNGYEQVTVPGMVGKFWRKSVPPTGGRYVIIVEQK